MKRMNEDQEKKGISRKRKAVASGKQAGDGSGPKKKREMHWEKENDDDAHEDAESGGGGRENAFDTDNRIFPL